MPTPPTAADLTGHRALVTGAASGIGAAIAARLVQSGAVVVAVDRDEAGLKDLAGRFDDGQVEPVPADLSDLDSIADLPTDIDILVNNAGIQHVAPIDDFPPDKWDAILAINLSASFHTVRAAVPGMKKKGWGRIVNIASIAAKYPLELRILSGAPRAALVNYAGAVARRVAPDNVTLNTVLPGMFHTAAVHDQFTATAQRNGTTYDIEVAKFVEAYQIPAKRFGDPRDIGALVTLLCSEFAGYITGQSIVVDGATTRSTF